eukprot:Amastigsp_a859124_3.p3 type:complete len:126 gc:universal Amastigsp_a859124_3:476-99(-)
MIEHRHNEPSSPVLGRQPPRDVGRRVRVDIHKKLGATACMPAVVQPLGDRVDVVRMPKVLEHKRGPRPPKALAPVLKHGADAHLIDLVYESGADMRVILAESIAKHTRLSAGVRGLVLGAHLDRR